MIHRDLCDPMNTKTYSSLRMQFNFLISRYVCWDGRVSLTFNEIADKLSCSLQSIYKFIRKGIREGMLSQEANRLYLLKHVDDYTKGYVKHLPFLESAEFQGLSLHAQRFILYSLWYGVHTGRPLKRSLSALYHSTPEYQGVLNIYSKKDIYPVLEEASAFLRLELTTVLGIEKVAVYGLREEYAHQQALENEGEFLWLERELVKLDCEDLVTGSAREDLLRMKKEYVKQFNDTGLDLFMHALKKLALSHKLFELTEEGEIGRYFRSILDELAEKLIPFIEKQIGAVKYALTTTEFIDVKEAESWINRFKQRLNTLQNKVSLLMNKFSPPPPISKPPVSDGFVFYNWLEEGIN